MKGRPIGREGKRLLFVTSPFTSTTSTINMISRNTCTISRPLIWSRFSTYHRLKYNYEGTSARPTGRILSTSTTSPLPGVTLWRREIRVFAEISKSSLFSPRLCIPASYRVARGFSQIVSRPSQDYGPYNSQPKRRRIIFRSILGLAATVVVSFIYFVHHFGLVTVSQVYKLTQEEWSLQRSHSLLPHGSPNQQVIRSKLAALEERKARLISNLEQRGHIWERSPRLLRNSKGEPFDNRIRGLKVSGKETYTGWDSTCTTCRVVTAEAVEKDPPWVLAKHFRRDLSQLTSGQDIGQTEEVSETAQWNLGPAASQQSQSDHHQYLPRSIEEPARPPKDGVEETNDD